MLKGGDVTGVPRVPRGGGARDVARARRMGIKSINVCQNSLVKIYGLEFLFFGRFLMSVLIFIVDHSISIF